MPRYQYQGRDAIPDIIPAGEYILEVVTAEESISNGQKTNGSDQIELKLKAEPSGARLYDTLIFHSCIDWRIDTFVRSVGIPAAEGKDLELTAADCVGRRGWASVRVRTRPDGSRRNEVAVWLTDREKLDRNEPEVDDFAEADGEPF